MNIETFIRNFILSNYSSIYVINIESDKIYEFKYLNNNIKVTNIKSYSEYLNNLNTFISKDCITGYINSLSIPYLKKNNNQVKYKYLKNIGNNNYKSYSDYIYYTNNIILILEKESSNTYGNIKNKNESNKLTSKITDAMLKIHNSLDINTNNMEIVELNNYINSILSDLIKSFPELNKAFVNTALDITSRGRETLLIIEDDDETGELLKKIFENNYNIIIIKDGKTAIDTLESIKKKDIFEVKENIVAIFLDLAIPSLDGFIILDYLKENNYLSKLPVAIISGDYSQEIRDKIYSYQIADILEKPFNNEVINHRINNLINLYKSSKSLNNLLSHQYTNMRNIVDNILKTYLYEYSKDIDRVKRITTSLASQFAIDYPVYNLNKYRIEALIQASIYYNLGYYLLPNNLKVKKAIFTEQDRIIINNYNKIAIDIIKNSSFISNSDLFYKYCEEIIINLNEAVDGTGYPNSIKGGSIPISSQFVALARQYIETQNVNLIMANANKKYDIKLIQTLKNIVNKSNNQK